MNLEKDTIKQTLQYFMDGFDKLDGSIILKAFHPKAQLFCYINGRLIEQTIEEFCKNLENARNYPDHPYNKEKCRKNVAYIDVFDNAASAKVEWVFSEFVYHDYYNLLKIDKQWYIMNKVFSKQII